MRMSPLCCDLEQVAWWLRHDQQLCVKPLRCVLSISAGKVRLMLSQPNLRLRSRLTLRQAQSSGSGEPAPSRANCCTPRRRQAVEELFQWSSMTRESEDWPAEWWYITGVPRSDVVTAPIRVPHARGQVAEGGVLRLYCVPSGSVSAAASNGARQVCVSRSGRSRAALEPCKLDQCREWLGNSRHVRAKVRLLQSASKSTPVPRANHASSIRDPVPHRFS